MPAIDPALLPRLRCPETLQPLALLGPDQTKRLTAEAGGMKNRGGKTASAEEAYLVREDGTVAYPVRGGIPLLLVEEGIALS